MNLISVWKLLYYQGDYVPEKIEIVIAGDTLDSVAKRLPGGAYTTLRTYQKNLVVGFDQHLTRLVESAKLVGNPVVLGKDRFRKAIRNIIHSIGKEYEGDLRIRIVLDLENKLGDLFVVISKLNILPDKFYQEGVNVTTCRLARDNPQAKLTGFISRADKVREIISGEYNEALILDDENRILEGLTSNFFAIKKVRLFTPATGILLGTTRSLVLDVAAKNGIPIIFSQISITEIKSIDGAFLTSASRGILPIRSINQEMIGTGSPDLLTQFLRQKYMQRMMAELEPI